MKNPDLKSEIASLQNLVADTLRGETGEDIEYAFQYCDKIDESFVFHGMDGVLTQLDYIISNVENEDVKERLEKIREKAEDLGKDVSEDKWKRSLNKLQKEFSGNEKEVEQEEIKGVRIPIKKAATQSVITVECPYCGYGRRVEPDADYTVTCENCGKKYTVSAPI